MQFDLPYNPNKLPRELKRYYISATDEEINSMLTHLGLNSLDELYNHINDDLKMDLSEKLADGLRYNELKVHLEDLADKNIVMSCFIGDALHHYKVPKIVEHVANVRGLTTAYTPYQPERSQGTLIGQWIYASALAAITGFEAINASLYDRSTALFEALNTATRIKRKRNKVIITESCAPQDLAVIKTLAAHTSLEIEFAPIDKNSGLTDLTKLRELINQHKDQLAAVAFTQVTHLGNLEDVHTITDLCSEANICSIAVVDPILMGEGGLIPPIQFGSKQQGTTMFVAEGQHMMSDPNLGGPGLGIFGIRYNQKEKMAIRNTPGRYVGKTKDINGNDAFCMVLSTREQHIRREKATSNICSNQAFAATLCGAALLERGAKGLATLAQEVRKNTQYILDAILQLDGVELAYPTTPFFNQVTLKLASNVDDFLSYGIRQGIEAGLNVSHRVNGENLLQIFISDHHSKQELDLFIDLFKQCFSTNNKQVKLPAIDCNLIRKNSFPLKAFSTQELCDYYTKLGELNFSPDDNLYPLGSCTMKYNPYINDYAANLKGFRLKHPQAPEENIQGSLEILYHIQELFKKITGLHSVATQPVAGANGELAGIKMFQAYFAAQGDNNRSIIILPRSAHGTNPATAAMAGFETKKVDGIEYGIVTVEADQDGQIDFPQLQEIVSKYNKRITGIMITNPNTSGIFETRFKDIADLIHQVGGLMYMDGANMNAIAGHIDLGKLGVDAVHNNLHKTWSISHGGGGPGDAIVAVSEKLAPFIVGQQVKLENGRYTLYKTENSIGEFHRHYGNFAHKIRGYTYLMALGGAGIKKMSAVAVLSARYLFEQLKTDYPTLPANTENIPRMHEFILTLEDKLFMKLQEAGLNKAQIIPQIGKLFLDFGIHAPTVAFPEPLGLMIEPTESFSQQELDKFAEVVKTIKQIIVEHPEALKSAPHFSAVRKVDEVLANKNLELFQPLDQLPEIPKNPYTALELQNSSVSEIAKKIVQASTT